MREREREIAQNITTLEPFQSQEIAANVRATATGQKGNSDKTTPDRRWEAVLSPFPRNT